MNNKTKYFNGELDQSQEDLINETPIEEDLKNEEIMQKSNEVDDGIRDNWIFENHNSLVSEFIGENNEAFNEYCKERHKEVKE